MSAAAIEERFRSNLDRVKNLVALYDSVTGGAGRGRPTVTEGDLLRAAVVMLHAALEDLLRSIALLKYPTASPEILGQFPLLGVKASHKPSFTLKELAAHRGKTVDDVLTKSIAAFLERSNYNNVGDIVKLLGEIGLPKSLAAPYSKQLAALMSRRHLIAHCADRNDRRGKGQHAAVSIGKSTIARWITAIDNFGKAVIDSL